MKTGGIRINYLPQDPIFSIDKSLLEIVMEKTCKDYPILEYQAKSILSKMGFNDYNITTNEYIGNKITYNTCQLLPFSFLQSL